MSNKDFYRAFEDRHRGSRELIKDRVSVYLPFILPLKKIYSTGLALDIGCGRGEWLELLKENDISAQGIDLDEGMLKACKLLNLDVQQGNGIEYLKKQENESLIAISTFHVVEHISFEDLQALVEESLRVLKPGGLLIMETPNPENIKVATENFYLDPTHINPIPSALLSFVPEFYGYKRSKILRLQEPKGLINQEEINFSDVLGGVSPDYSVVAQKDASDDILKQFNEVFSQEFGLPLTTLTAKFENRLILIESKASQAEEKANQAEEKASQAEEKASQAEEKANQAEEKANQAEEKANQAEEKANQAEVRTNGALHHYHMVVNSNSWKLTKPLRLVGKTARWFVTGVKHWVTFSPTSRPRRVLKSILLKMKHRINANPKLKNRINTILNNFPILKNKIKKLTNPSVSVNVIYVKAEEIPEFLKKIKTEIELHKDKRMNNE